MSRCISIAENNFAQKMLALFVVFVTHKFLFFLLLDSYYSLVSLFQFNLVVTVHWM
jgi:hypothetical protein